MSESLIHLEGRLVMYGLVNVARGAAPATWMRATRVTRADFRAAIER